MAIFAKAKKSESAEMSFLDHLEELRWHLVRSVVVIFALAIVFFINKDFLFNTIILAPKNADFFTYKFMCKLSHLLQMGDALCMNGLEFSLINTTLSGQFTLHMWAAFLAGIVVGFPYLVWEAWRFIKPALTATEIGYSKGILFFVSILFSIGVLFGYYLIAPLSINFLGTYQVSSEVKNMIDMDSYISTITVITFASGLLFELPIVVYFLSSLGIISPAFMKRYRKHAVVVILILAAVITPSPDITSQLLVALPVYVLYELSIFVSAYVVNKKEREVV
ncbi:MAG: twin-arginine translocase subunit TatC [Bacteroidota bacterium]|jgi:sec-independent protein translocase protein TatC